MIDLVLNIVTLSIKPFYEKNLSYFILIDNFKKKLPRPQNQARKLSDKEKENKPLMPDFFKYVNVVDLSTHQSSISEQDLDLFINSIQYFDYSFMLFKPYYKAYSNNILRFKPTSKNGDMDLVVLQEVVKDNAYPLKPFAVLIYHFKLRLKFKLFKSENN